MNPPDPLLAIADALAQGVAVDWASAAQQIDPALLASLRELQQLAQGFGEVASAAVAAAPATQRLLRPAPPATVEGSDARTLSELRLYDLAMEQLSIDQRDVLGMRLELALDFAEIARLKGLPDAAAAREAVIAALLALAEGFDREA